MTGPVAADRAAPRRARASWPEKCLSSAGLQRGLNVMLDDLVIIALTLGLYGAAAWFVRVCERM